MYLCNQFAVIYYCKIRQGSCIKVLCDCNSTLCCQCMSCKRYCLYNLYIEVGRLSIRLNQERHQNGLKQGRYNQEQVQKNFVRLNLCKQNTKKSLCMFSIVMNNFNIKNLFHHRRQNQDRHKSQINYEKVMILYRCHRLSYWNRLGMCGYIINIDIVLLNNVLECRLCISQK